MGCSCSRGLGGNVLLYSHRAFQCYARRLGPRGPAWVPFSDFMLTFTGVCEIFGAVGLLLPRARRIAAVALIVFLIAVLPANIHAAINDMTICGKPVTPLLPRIALQILFIARDLVVRHTQPKIKNGYLTL